MPKPSDIPVCPVALPAGSLNQVIRDYQISLITPLFGGGVEAGAPDETLPIRGISIRGQLQFWWRATLGAAFATGKDLFDRHAEVWGKTERRSPVEIEIRDVDVKTPLRRCAKYDGGPRPRWETPFDGSQNPLPYALFPFQGTAAKGAAQFIEAASFTLRIRYPPALLQDVEAAVRAWVSFGGLGSRTRRGCGALMCRELAPQGFDDIQRWFRACPLPGPAFVRDWPTMPHAMLVGDKPEDSIEAWKKVIGLLKEFRQGEGVGRNRGRQPNRPGRSRYPEPETIRFVTGTRPQQHPRLANIPEDAFPRAEFGLPIIFHFQGQGEPADTELYPSRAADGERRERMASPLVLKPLAMADGKAVPLVLRLAVPPISGVELKHGSRYLPFPSTAVRDARLAAYRDPDSPIKDSASGSAIEAFRNHARKSGFREVTR